jgi:hypothetical protein
MASKKKTSKKKTSTARASATKPAFVAGSAPGTKLCQNQCTRHACPETSHGVVYPPCGAENPVEATFCFACKAPFETVAAAS